MFWEQAYRFGDIPWDSPKPDPTLVRAVRRGWLKPAGRALEIGSGTGTNALYLAQNGFRVVGIDVSPTAVRRAREKARAVGAACQFRVADVLRWRPSERFDVIFERGVFHSLEDEKRPIYAHSVRTLLKPGGRTLMLCFSDKEPGWGGPRRISRREIREIFAPCLRLLWIRDVNMVDTKRQKIRSYATLMEKPG
ncbi:MAG: class I SAM-dependent methyltransferase [Chloroflexi bacterium]|nr:class I SAM-dependent methyltransferase [Chloroflexota bacterium]